MKSIIRQSSSSGVTRALGRKLAEQITRGGTLLLEGELGVGKTTFVQGLASGLEITNDITSPTFVLMNVYPCSYHPVIQRLVHLDLYRLTDNSGLNSLDLHYWQSNPHTLMVVEWPERAPEQWQNILGTLTFEIGDFTNRQITATGLTIPWLS